VYRKGEKYEYLMRWFTGIDGATIYNVLDTCAACVGLLINIKLALLLRRTRLYATNLKE
jgi:hypothetical protein